MDEGARVTQDGTAVILGSRSELGCYDVKTGKEATVCELPADGSRVPLALGDSQEPEPADKPIERGDGDA